MRASERLLQRLNGVRETGAGTWISCCPAHRDRTPSLSIREVDDRVLLHCFGGCSAADVVAALGLGLADLFDEPLAHHLPGTRSRIPVADRLACIDHEALVVALLASHMSNGWALTDAGRERLLTAAARIGDARDVGGSHQQSKQTTETDLHADAAAREGFFL